MCRHECSLGVYSVIENYFHVASDTSPVTITDGDIIDLSVVCL